MMNFPDTPTAGQTFTDAASGAQYVYTNGVWMQSSAAQIKQTARPRNRMINGAMQISQEIAKETVQSLTNTYIADQWLVYFVNGGAPNFACRDTYHPEDPETTAWIRLNNSVADAAVAAGDFYSMRQPMEGLRIADFKWGSAQAKPAVLRFKAFSSVAGTFCVSVRNAAGTQAFVKNCTIAANTLTLFTIPIPATTVGTWPVDNTLGLHIAFSIMAGSTFNAAGVDGQWVASNPIATPQISNWLATANQYLDIADVGLYLDPEGTGVAPPWEVPNFADDLFDCYRYFWDFRNPGIWDVGQAVIYNTTQADVVVYFPVPMRVVPTFTGTGSYNMTGGGGSTVLCNMASSGNIATRMATLRMSGTALIGPGTGFCQTGDSSARFSANARM